MYQERKYRCLRCWQRFTLTDGVVCNKAVGVECPHCKSHLTIGI